MGKSSISASYQSEGDARRENGGGKNNRVYGWGRGLGRISCLTIPTSNQPLFISLPYLLI